MGGNGRRTVRRYCAAGCIGLLVVLLHRCILQNFRFTLKSGQADKITYSLMITMSGTFCVLHAVYVLRSLACVRRLVECN